MMQRKSFPSLSVESHLCDVFGDRWVTSFQEDFGELDVASVFPLTQPYAEVALMYALDYINVNGKRKVDLITLFTMLYQKLDAKQHAFFRAVVLRYFFIHLQTNVFIPDDVEVPPFGLLPSNASALPGAMKLVAYFVPSKQSDACHFDAREIGLPSSTVVLDLFFQALREFRSHPQIVIDVLRPLVILLANSMNRDLRDMCHWGDALLTILEREPLAYEILIDKTKLSKNTMHAAAMLVGTSFGSVLSCSQDLASKNEIDSRALTSDDPLSDVDSIRKLNEANHPLNVYAANLNHKIIRRALSHPIYTARVIQWIDAALNINVEWKKSHGNILFSSPPSLLATIFHVSLLLVQPMFAQLQKQFSRLQPQNFYHPKCLITQMNEEHNKRVREDFDCVRMRQEIEAEPHAVLNLFALSLKSFHFMSCLMHKIETNVPNLRAQWIRTRDAALQTTILSLIRLYHSASSMLQEPTFVQLTLNYILFVMSWLECVARGGVGDNSSVVATGGINLVRNWTPLPEQSPANWKFVDQDLFEDIGTILTFLIHNSNLKVDEECIEHSLNFLMLFVGNTNYMLNKHHRGKYALILRDLLERCNPILFDSPHFVKVIFSCLIQCYVDVESLGQFKIEPRHHLNCILNRLWAYENIQVIVRARSASMDEQFCRFINMLLSDGNQTLEAAIEYLRKICIKTKENLNNNTTDENPSSVDDEGERQPHTIEDYVNIVRNNMQLANEILRFVTALCQGAPESFLQGLITDQVASMLGNFFIQLAGPKMIEIKVEEVMLERCAFHHRELVQLLVECYLGIAASEQRSVFIASMVQDERGYQPTIYRDILRFLRAKCVLPDRLSDLEAFFHEAEALHTQHEEFEEAWADAPSSYLCQITYGLLIDPVALPKMPETYVESRSIYRHLLTEEFNPFNRQPLTSQQLTEYNNTAEILSARNSLRKEIEEWKKYKLLEHRAKKGKI